MTPKVDGPDHISPSLWPLVVPIDEVVPWKGNARRGNVPAVMKSLERFGQRKPVVAQRSTGAVSAGNHLLAAALKMGWTHIAVSWEDDDEATAEAFALADNNTHDVGFGYDAILLDQAILRITAIDPSLLEAAGYDVKLNDDDDFTPFKSAEPVKDYEKFADKAAREVVDPQNIIDPEQVVMFRFGDLRARVERDAYKKLLDAIFTEAGRDAHEAGRLAAIRLGLPVEAVTIGRRGDREG